MKKIVLMILVAIVPFLTMAQGKKAKKRKNLKTEKISESNSAYEFMIITGYEMTPKEGSKAVPAESEIKEILKPKIRINFDFGGIRTNEIPNLLRESRNFRTMAGAVNAAAKEGWNFISSDIILSGKNKIYYYYMKRDK